MDKKFVAKELLKIAKDLSALDRNTLNDRTKDRGWIPVEIRPILNGLIEEKPYIYYVSTDITGRYKSDANVIVNWAKKNGSPSSKVIHGGYGDEWYVKIVDPLCGLLERHGFLKKKH